MSAAGMKRIVTVLPSLAGGGAERVALTLLAGLDRRRFDPHLLLLTRSGPLEAMLPAYLPVLDMARPRLLRGLPALLRALRHLRPDVTFSTLGYVNLGLLAMRDLIPGRLVIREANLPSLSLPHSPYPATTAVAYRCLYRRADRVLATSQRMANELAGFGVPPDRLAILANPVAMAVLRDQAAMPRRLPGPGLRLVGAGRLTEQKGFDRLIPLLSGLPDLRLLILGEGQQRTILSDLARQHGVAVEMPGFVQNAPAWFAGADAVLLPSRWEGMSNAALESLACGTPVIATPESGGIAEVAAAAAVGAVTVVSTGAELVSAVRTLSPRKEVTLRPNLLPATYDAETVARLFADHLEEVN